jgi:5-methylcytosine-specific restriction enzyme A
VSEYSIVQDPKIIAQARQVLGAAFDKLQHPRIRRISKDFSFQFIGKKERIAARIYDAPDPKNRGGILLTDGSKVYMAHTGNFSADAPGIQSFYLERTKRQTVPFSYNGEEFNAALIADLGSKTFYEHFEDFLAEALEIKAQQSKKNPNWATDELIVALDFYLRHGGKPPPHESKEIKQLSEQIARIAVRPSDSVTYRNVNGVYMKLMNFRRFDPQFKGQEGLKRGGKTEEEVWNMYAHKPALCSKVAESILNNAGSAELLDLADETLEEAAEGRVLTRKHSIRERNPKIIRKCKERFKAKHGELYCEACGFKPNQKYGLGYDKIIECHHTKPLHTLKPGDKTKISDLVLLCSNCHRAVHSHKQWLSMEALKLRLKSVSG